MNLMKHPSISCPRIHSFQARVSPEELSGEELLLFQQAWRDEPETDFMPGRVRMGWAPEGFVVWAEMKDRDIFNPVRVLNEPAYTKGDVFEIFLRPQTSDAYYEFHITPYNQLFQYAIPSAAEFRNRRGKGICQEWLLSAPVLESHTKIDPVAGIWQVAAKLSVTDLGLLPLKRNDHWKFSFCRYDYSKNRAQPVLSSTSPLNKIDFHDQSCWKEMTLV